MSATKPTVRYFLLLILMSCNKYKSYAYGSNDTVINSTEYNIQLMLLICTLLLIAVLALSGYIIYIQRKNKSERMTDNDTGMGNLYFFRHKFENIITDDVRKSYFIAYIILDSSYLRSYHKESAFDDVLQDTAEVFSEHNEKNEFAARITENGFAYAYFCENDEEAYKKLKAIMKKLNSFKKSKEKSNKLVFHAAFYHLEKTDKNCELLLFNLRKNCNKIFGIDKQIIRCDVHTMNAIREEKNTVECILKGFENAEFKMYLQFIVDNDKKNIVSAEALSRWHSPENGIVGPGNYIENMENAGLISRHDFYMFELACKQLEKWKNTNYKKITLSCNFTRITLSEEDFIDKLKNIADSYDFDRAMLAIEITEDAMEKDMETATDNVRKCKELGFRVYLDDLGSGYTSLANLCDYPIDVVKIDRDILLKTNSKRGRDLFTGIIALAHSLDIEVVCEGVETEEQNNLVSSTECDYIQGWYYTKALPVEECEAFVEAYSGKQSD